MSDPLGFVPNLLDRVSEKRRDSAWVAARLDDESSRFLPFWRLNALVKRSGPALAWATREIREQLDPRTGAILLGLRDGVAHFAVDVSPLAEPVEALGLGQAAHFADARAVATGLPAGEAGVLAQGRQMIDWHARHRFCAVCGKTTSVKEAGYLRECDECDAQHFPRTDPVAIMLVHDGDRCVLGRQKMFPATMYSALAGFVEAGETLEDAVRREVAEEVGLAVGEVSYHRSQPWPFPSSLMLGCLARATSSEITVDKFELEDARWFERAEILRALREPGKAGFFVPPPLAIAHHLIRFWAES